MKMNNDRFKFRVWELKYRIMHNSWDVEGFYGDLLDISEELEDDKFVIQQCTGLKDKNGKLMFEGDIVRYVDGYNSSTENGFDCEDFLNTGEIVWSENENGWDITRKESIDRENVFHPKFIEVIGNIFENEGLLNV